MLILLFVGLIAEDLNLTEHFSQENRMGERKSDFMSLKNMSEEQSKVNSKVLLWQSERILLSGFHFFSYYLILDIASFYTC